MGWRRYAKPKYGMIATFLLLVGVIVPAGFGLLTTKAMEIGTADLLDKSTNWDDTNIANSTYFLAQTFNFKDNETATWYREQIVYDDANDLHEAMLDTSGTSVGSYTGVSDTFYYELLLNQSALDNVDKIVVVFRILDAGQLNLDNSIVAIRLYTDGWSTILASEDYNATDAYNNTIIYEIPIDAVRRLKIQSASDVWVRVLILPKSGSIELNNAIVGVRVELYDVKKVNATSAANAMLVGSGILAWIGALAATPYWNPMKEPSHRDVRRVARRVRRFRRRR